MCLKCLHAYYMLRKVVESPRLASGDGTLEGGMDANGVSSFVFYGFKKFTIYSASTSSLILSDVGKLV